MNQISPPPLNSRCDRFIRCQEAMETAFLDLATAANDAGWNTDEVAAALVELADNNVLSLLADRNLGAILANFNRQ